MRCMSEVRPVIETCKGFIASLETVWPPFFGTTQNGSLSSVHPINSAYSSKISDKYPKKPSTTFANPIHHILIQFSSNFHHILIQFSNSLSVSRCFPATRTMGLGRTSASDLGHHPVVVGSQARNEDQWLPFGGFQWFPWGIPKMYGLQWKIHEHPIKVDELEHVGTNPHGLEAISQAFRHIFC